MAGAVSVLSVSVNADIINLAYNGVNSSGGVSISGVINGSVAAGQYQLLTEDGTTIDAFCVDPTFVKNGFLAYEVVTPEELGDQFVKAAWLWDNISFGNDDAVAAQVAIWETTWDDGVSLSYGDFTVNAMNPYSQSRALNMLAALSDADLTNFDASGYHVVTNAESQDFLVKYSVPEPGTFGFMLMGLVCIAGMIRRKKD